MKTRLLILFSFVVFLVLISPSFHYFISGYGEEQNIESLDSLIKIEDKSFDREILQTGETFTLQGTVTAVIIEGLGVILIIFFIVIYAIKKRKSKC